MRPLRDHLSVEQTSTRPLTKRLKGVSESHLITLRDGRSVIFKPSPQDSNVKGKWAANPAMEVIAYKLSELLDMDLVPRTTFESDVLVKDTISGKMIRKEGSAQDWIEDAVPMLRLPEKLIKKAPLHEKVSMGILDYLLGNRDRHGGNILVKMSDGTLVAIDHGLADPIRAGKTYWEMARVIINQKISGDVVQACKSIEQDFYDCCNTVGRESVKAGDWVEFNQDGKNVLGVVRSRLFDNNKNPVFVIASAKAEVLLPKQVVKAWRREQTTLPSRLEQVCFVRGANSELQAKTNAIKILAKIGVLKKYDWTISEKFLPKETLK